MRKRCSRSGTRILAVRAAVQKELESGAAVGRHRIARCRRRSTITARRADYAALATLGDDLRFVLITSAATVQRGRRARRSPSRRARSAKCERCWHWRADVGADPTHPTLCGRCVANLFGAGRARASHDRPGRDDAAGVNRDGATGSRWLWLRAAVIVARPGDRRPRSWRRSGRARKFRRHPFFSLVLAFNTGAAFSFLAGADGWQRWLFAGDRRVAAVRASSWLLQRGGGSLLTAPGWR